MYCVKISSAMLLAVLYSNLYTHIKTRIAQIITIFFKSVRIRENSMYCKERDLKYDVLASVCVNSGAFEHKINFLPIWHFGSPHSGACQSTTQPSSGTKTK